MGRFLFSAILGALLVGVVAPSEAGADAKKAPAAKAPVKLSAGAENVVRLAAARSLPASLDAKAVADLKAIAAKLRNGQQSAAVAAWKAFLTANAKKLTASEATQTSDWFVRVALLEPEAKLAAAADKVRYVREGQTQLAASMLLLSKAQQQAQKSGKKVKVTWVSLLPYQKFKSATQAAAREMTAEQAKAKRDQLKAAKDSLDEMNAQDMLMLQQMMEQKNQLETMISNAMKANADTQNNLASALKS